MKSSLLKSSAIVVSLIALFSVLSNWNHGWELGATVPESVPLHLTGSENHSISLETAVRMTTRYRADAPVGATLAESFGRDAITAILAHPRCVGLKVYHGVNDDGRQAVVLIGVDGDGNDITDGYVGDNGIVCPPICGNSPLTGQAF
jgi:hypothetical protein